MSPSPLWVRWNRLPLNRQLAWLHRWAGVAFCLFFLLWFVTGAVLHFVGFPALADGDRHAASAAIDTTRLRLGPAAALAADPGATGLRLVSIAGRPVYLLEGAGPPLAVAGDDGSRLGQLDIATARAIAQDFASAHAVEATGPLDFDQWTVHQHFDLHRPFYRITLDDPDATDLYVSARSGEVIQRTRAAERAWNWCGAVLHWIYFTPLRKDWGTWNQAVWWVSLAALATACVGFWLGIVRWAGRPRPDLSAISPFRGWLRWHHILGLFAGCLVLAWIFSGWLSMDHGRLFSRGAVPADLAQRLRGVPLDRIAAAAPLETLRGLEPATEVGFGAIGAHPFMTIYGPDAPDGRVQFVDVTPAAAAAIPLADIQGALETLWPARVTPVASGALDTFYRLAESVPQDAAAFDIRDDGGQRLYVDRHSGRPLVMMDASRKAYAWTYYALHTWNLPGIDDKPLLRTIWILSLLALGSAFSLTGVIVGVRRIRQDLAWRSSR